MRQRTLATTFLTGFHPVTEPVSAWSGRRAQTAELDTWTCDATQDVCRAEIKLFQEALQRAQLALHGALVQQSGLKVRPLDIGWRSCGEVSYHHDEYFSNESLYFFWVTHLSEGALFIIDDTAREVRVGDWFVFDAYNLHALRKKNPGSPDAPPLQMIFGLGTIDLSIAWRKRMGVRVRPPCTRENRSYPDYSRETGVVFGSSN